ncbi:C-type lectin domain family 4 member G isoform X4 [Xenopus laevis]|uniref:C-type lectin domain family 4 member G isoform X4 n=1 Tax=Xenopus laevis TaxID=8355 RepID=A0A8J1MNV0_XENLA|nr:C-type lectin domain family 4 member G isoform X4 [Xenopus laevis]
MHCLEEMMNKESRSGDPGGSCMWHGGGRTTLRRNQSTGQKDIPIHWHKMDRGKLQSDSDIYGNITFTEEPTGTALKMRKIQQEPKEENLSPKFLKATETLRTQRRLLMILVTLLVLAFIFLIILTSLMFIYYSMVSSQLKQQDEEKDNLLTQITTINQTIDEQKANLLTQISTTKQTLDKQKTNILTQITAMQQTLDSMVSSQLKQQDEEKANLLTQITTINQTIDKQKTNILTQITAMQQTLDSRISESMRSTKQDILQTIENEKPKCDSNWKAFDGSCYYIVTTKKNWDNAQETCKSMNSDLVIINSDRKKNFLESITDSSYFWIGLKRDKNNKDEWRWVDGTYYYPPQRFWLKGEPNNDQGREDCVHMWKEKKWNDVFCTDEYKAICEKK